jgi:hypothetical protein
VIRLKLILEVGQEPCAGFVHGAVSENRFKMAFKEIVPKLVGDAEPPEPGAPDVGGIGDAKLIPSRTSTPETPPLDAGFSLTSMPTFLAIAIGSTSRVETPCSRMTRSAAAAA